MNGLKKVNLLPTEIKIKYSNRYLKYLIVMIAVVMVAIPGVQFANAGVLGLQINYYKEQNAKYEQEKKNIEELQNSIISYNAYIDEYEKGVFPFEKFMNNLEDIRPESVYIISVDTTDRLINEGEHEDEKEDKNSAKDGKSEKEDKSTETVEETKETDVQAEIKYVDDLTGKDIVIRGFGKKQNDISSFIYGLAELAYINNAKITAIEEHEMLDGQKYNIFEIVVQGGENIENHNAR